MDAIIERYLDESNLGRIRRDFQFLLDTVKRSRGELELALRKGRVSIYYRGNSLATITLRPREKYRIDIHSEFYHPNTRPGRRPRGRLEMPVEPEEHGRYMRVEVDARDAHRVLQKTNRDKLMWAIRDLHHSEELAFEQILITDNPPTRHFMLIDRQVQDSKRRQRLDLLGLRRLDDGRYGFVVIEVKLGKNEELSEAVAGQLQGYVDHIRKWHGQYRHCYELNYAQKRQLGLFDDDLPEQIEICGEHVEGLVVVGGYTRQADEQAEQLKASHGEIKVLVFRNRLINEDGSLRETL